MALLLGLNSQLGGDLLLHGHSGFLRLVGGADQVGRQLGLGLRGAYALPAWWNLWRDFQRVSCGKQVAFRS